MKNDRYFHFTIGPVQSFVGQARRTRDFWAGSFLLSWLSGVAMESVGKPSEKVLFPVADTIFLNAINGAGTKKPQQGSIPNRFKAKVEADFKPEKVINNVQEAWKALTDEIYNKEIFSRKKEIENAVQQYEGFKKFSLDRTKKIWDRQIKHFWDMTWVLVDDVNDSSCLDRRKNWRSHYLPDEPGIKCTLMGDWQELSGIEGVRKKDHEAREAFWQALASGKSMDFSAKEQLCAMSYIKRRFVRYFDNFEVDLDKFTACGWNLPKSVPSVSYIAAAPWFGKVLESSKNTPEFIDFFNKARELESLSEYSTSIACVDAGGKNKEHKGLDGNVFHEHELDNINTFPDRKKAERTKQALKKLIRQHGAISPFYAVLMMDGDSLGKQMGDVGKQKHITSGLSKFTQGVPELVKGNNGFLIYAGGDDVLALVTLEHALPCALAIRQHYEKCFQEAKEKELIDKTSISAAIIYTHIGAPLKNVLHEAHAVLDRVAKDQAGRDALAVRVYKGSGLALEWARKWDDCIVEGEIAVQEMAADLREIEKKKEQFSSKFLYKIRQRFELFYGKGGEGASPLSPEQAVDLMAMEYSNSLDKRGFTMDDARKVVRPLMQQSYNAAAGNRITADAALLVRFLAQKGIEGGRS